MDDHPHFIGSGATNRSLARRLGLRHDHGMQDWEREMADPDLFDVWLASEGSCRTTTRSAP